jgi:hypothetical protein
MQKQYVMTVAGGLMLTLLATSCASKSHTRNTANPPPRDRAVASDRNRSTDESRIASADRRTDTSTPNANEMAATERPVPFDRTGSADNRTPADRVVPCADDKGDMTASMDCRPGNRRTNDRSANDRTVYSPEALAACAHRTDDQGRIVYDDPKCPTKYRSQMGSSFENVDWTRESAFFDRYMNKAVKHAREAEIAANQGHTPEMLRHAELSLDQAKEAQRAGNVPGLEEGIISLRDVLRQGQGAQGSQQIHEARIKLSQAAGMKPKDTRPMGRATQTSTSPVGSPRTVRGELIGDESASRADGNRQYVLRDPAGADTRILLPPDLTQNVQPGDIVEAQLDPDGHVVGINKQ